MLRMMKRRSSVSDMSKPGRSWRKIGFAFAIVTAMLTMAIQVEGFYRNQNIAGSASEATGDYPSNGVRRRTQEWLIQIPNSAAEGAISDGSNPSPTEADSAASDLALLPLVEEDEDIIALESDEPMIDEFDGTLPIGSLRIRYPGFCRKTSTPLVPSLETHRIWRSKRQRIYSDVSIVTQLSIERLDMLRGQCSVWGSVISAAVHVPMLNHKVVTESTNPGTKLNRTSLEDTVALIDAFHKDLDANSKCKLDLVMLIEEIPSSDLYGLYPVNALRNRALQLSRTELVFLLDADFLPAKDLSADIKNPEKYATLRRVTQYKQAIVIPALETVDHGDAGSKVALKAVESKAAATTFFKNGQLRGFHMDHFENGHRATDFDRWMKSTVAYRVNYEEGFEPYVIAQRKFVPWYDERFKGYRKNKVVHLMNMFHSGMTFVANPRGFVVHSPHVQARSWEVTQNSGFWDKLKRLYFNTVDAMARDEYVPATVFKCDSRYPEKWSWYKRRSHRKLMTTQLL